MDFKNIVIYTDIDGTLTSVRNNHSYISEKNLMAAQEFISLGGLIGAASGRSVSSIKRIFADVNLNLPYVQANGACVYDQNDDTYVFKSIIEKKIKDVCFAYVKTNKNTVLVALDDKGSKKVKINDERDEFLIDYPRPLVDYDDLITNEYLKLAFYVFDNIDIEKEKLRKLIDEKYEVFKSGDHFIEIIDRTASKGKGVNYVRDKYHLEDKLLVCIGDYDNDISMLEIADIAICPSNALEKVKKICDYISVDKNDAVLVDVLKYLRKL